MKKLVKKLELAKETLRKLETPTLEKVVGGLVESDMYTCYSGTC